MSVIFVGKCKHGVNVCASVKGEDVTDWWADDTIETIAKEDGQATVTRCEICRAERKA